MNKINKHTLNEMQIKSGLNMSMIYSTIKRYISNGNKLTNNLTLNINENYSLTIFNQISPLVNFTIGTDSFNVFLKPIKYKLIINESKFIQIEIIAISQLRGIFKEYNFNQGLIFCPICGNKFFSIQHENLEAHENHEGACLKESVFLNKLLKENFGQYFKENFVYINKTFKPLEFEPNFSLYFKKSDIILKENKLHFFEDIHSNRVKIYSKINSQNTANSLIKFFGQPGRGKTLTLIGILKYSINHASTGTFYINCKALANLKEIIKIKQLLIDEIPFLFYNNYEGYNNCAQSIQNYIYDNSKSFFQLINLIIDQIIEIKNKTEYLIVLDQYNDKIDKGNKELNLLYEKLIIKKCEKAKDITFCLITFSSMNNRDIRNYKIMHMNNIIEKQNSEGQLLYEIDKLEYNLSIDNGGLYDENLKKLGNGLKYYNILKYYHSHQYYDDMMIFIKNTKIHIRENLFEFFNINEDIVNPSHLNILCSFSTDVAYSGIKLKEIINNIPFKYFDVVSDETKENEYRISFSFPIVGEVVNEIYSDIINKNPNLYINLTKKELDEGAKGKFFEKIVTYYLNINSSIYENKLAVDFFDDYLIQYHHEMEVLVLNNNEEMKIISEKTNLENGVHLITQKRYNGKALDIALINVSEVIEIIGIQISIHKNKIYTIDEISDFLKTLNQNVYNYYGIRAEEKNLYFCYIFELNNLKNSMAKKCVEKNIKYLFFDVLNKSFVNILGQKITKLKPNLSIINFSEKDISPNQIESQDFLSKECMNALDNEKLTLKLKKGPLFQINDNQKNTITNIIKEKLESKIGIELKYRYSADFLLSSFLEMKNRFCISKYYSDTNDINDEINCIVMITNFKKQYIIKENGEIDFCQGNFQKPFDYYIAE